MENINVSSLTNNIDGNAILYGIVGLFVLYLVIKLLKWPIKLLINGIIGIVLLYLTNFIGGNFGFSIPVNAMTALVSGILGIPGIIFLILFNL